VGQAKFGAGGGPLNVTTPLPISKPAYYFRKRFTINSPPEEFLLSATCTDAYGGVVYPLRVFLNGAELKTSGIEAVTGQGNEVRHYDLHPFIPLLNTGANTIAVILNNAVTAGWDDIAFDLSLKTIPARTVATGLTITRQPSGIVLQASTPRGIWKVESCDAPALNTWRLLQVFTNTIHTLTVPNQKPSCFFRLTPY
jgi:hypothetical protein